MWTQFHRLLGPSFLISGACLLVGEVNLEFGSGFLVVGGSGAFPLVNKNRPCPSGGHRHVWRWLGLQKTLGSCVLALLVVWSELSQQ